MAMASASKLGRYSQRVGAWMVSVVNPAIDSLRREAELLAKGNISWRYFSKQCEYIRPIRQYIEGNYRPNYDDFLADNPRFRKKFEEHDSALLKIEDAASKFAAALLHDPNFKFQADRAMKEYASESAYPLHSSELRPPSLDGMNPGLPETIAEYLINNVESLPRHYMTYNFWERYREHFVHVFKPQKSALPRAVKQLEGISNSLKAALERHRLNLCRQYDIPPVPIPSRNPIDDVLSHR